MNNFKRIFYPLVIGFLTLPALALFADKGGGHGSGHGKNHGHHGGGHGGNHNHGGHHQNHWRGNNWGVGVGGYGSGIGYYGGYPYSSYGTYGYPSTHDTYYYDTTPGYNSGTTFFYIR